MNDISFTTRRNNDPLQKASGAADGLVAPFPAGAAGFEEAQAPWIEASEAVLPEAEAPQLDAADTGVDAEGLEDTRTRTLVLSDIPGMAEMVARGLAKDEGLNVTHRRMSLAELVVDERFDISSVDLIVFQIRPGNDADLNALREFRAALPDLKLLGVSAEMLSLATARALMDAGVDEVMPLTSVQPASSHATGLDEAVDAGNKGRAGGIRNGMILAVAGARGGIGTTSFAMNLATLLARREKKDDTETPRVAIVDLDYQNGVLGASIDIHDGGAYLDLLKGEVEPDRAFVKRAFIHHEEAGFDVLPAPASIAPLDALTPEKVAVLLDELRLSYDYIVLDLPRSLVDWVDPILVRADRFFILGDTTVHTVRQMRRMMDLYTDDHAALPIDLIVSMKSKPFSPGPDIKEAERFLDRKLGAWVPLDVKSATRASDHGKPILVARPKSPIAKAMAPIVATIREAHANSARRRA